LQFSYLVIIKNKGAIYNYFYEMGKHASFFKKNVGYTPIDNDMKIACFLSTFVSTY